MQWPRKQRGAARNSSGSEDSEMRLLFGNGATPSGLGDLKLNNRAVHSCKRGVSMPAS